MTVCKNLIIDSVVTFVYWTYGCRYKYALLVFSYCVRERLCKKSVHLFISVVLNKTMAVKSWAFACWEHLLLNFAVVVFQRCNKGCVLVECNLHFVTFDYQLRVIFFNWNFIYDILSYNNSFVRTLSDNKLLGCKWVLDTPCGFAFWE